MHVRLKSLGLLWSIIGVQSARLRDKEHPVTIFIKCLYSISNSHLEGYAFARLEKESQLNRIWVQSFFGLRWGPAYTHPVPFWGSDLEDRLRRSAGRCSPLVTFTISPTATYTSQFKRIKMGWGGETNNRENKNQTNGQKRQKVWNHYRRGFMLIKMSNADFFQNLFWSGLKGEMKIFNIQR